MSELSIKLLETNHKGVHEQFDCVYSATIAYANLINNNDLRSTLRTHHKKVIKTEIKKAMKSINFKPGFLKSGLAYYAYEFWEIITKDRLGNQINKKTINDYANEFLGDLAKYLDSQYKTEGRADSIGYLKSIL